MDAADEYDGENRAGNDSLPEHQDAPSSCSPVLPKRR